MSKVDILDTAAFLADIRRARDATTLRCAEWLIAHHRATSPRNTGRLAEGVTVDSGPGYASAVCPEDRVRAVIVNTRLRRWRTIWTAWPRGMMAVFQAEIDRIFAGVKVRKR